MNVGRQWNGKALAVVAALVLVWTSVEATAQAGRPRGAGSRRASPQARVSPPKVGDPAPDLDLEVLLQAPANASAAWDDLRGKVVVLEFWATWCRPCVSAFPHLNELVEHFEGGDDVVFIAITDEPRAKVEALLEKKPLNTWIGLDTDRSSLKRYAVNGIPRTVIVDRDGRIAADTYPTMVTSAVLERVGAGKSADLPSLPTGPGFAGPGDADGEMPPMPGMPGSIDDINKMQLELTAPGAEHRPLRALAGRWQVETTIFPAGPMGPELSATATRTAEWIQGGRVLRVVGTTDGDPRVERLSFIGYDNEEREYYLCEISPLEPAPVLWSGTLNEDGSRLEFTRSMTIQIFGGPGAGPDDDGDGSGLEVSMKRVFELRDADEYTSTLSIDLSALAAMAPPGFGGAPTGEDVMAKAVARRVK